MHVVVVGGGIVGVACAHYLRERGAGVTLLERSRLGGGSTGRANGGVRAAFASPVNVALSRASVEVWERFEAEFGTGIDFRRSGYLFLAREASTAERLREHVAVQNDRGVPSELVDPEAAREHCPGLGADRYAAALYSPTDGVADPHLALQGFASAATEAGADLRTGVAVTDVHRRADGRVTGVETTDGDVGADCVVNAAGPWARQVAAMAGLDLPVVPKRRQLAVVEPERPVGESVPLTADLDCDVHFRPERDGAAVVGGQYGREARSASERASGERETRPEGASPPARARSDPRADPDADPDAYREGMDLDWAATVLERAADCADYFGPESRVRRGWAGLYAVTPDHHPVVEETVPGFVNAVGFSGHGFMHAPATGRTVAELVVDGEATTVDVSVLAADRFERGATLSEGTVID